MNIGFISTWFERGAAYVTKAYIDLLKDKHNTFVYARGGEYFASDDLYWNQYNVTWGKKLSGTNVDKNHFYKWVNENKIDVLFFNEQHEFDILLNLKKDFPLLKIGAYIDYYKENTIELFDVYDFLICNTKRHAFAFRNHKQMFYVPWGTDIVTFNPENKKPFRNTSNTTNKISFFHSAGMSNRKGTDLLIEAFIKGELYKKSNLIIHTQCNLDNIMEHYPEDIEKYNIEIINKTVSAPGLYHLGDVYVYPTKLEGLGLTLFEALSSGLPVITTDSAPMNEIINESNKNGKLINVNYSYSRKDAYYWPMSVSDVNDLIIKMKFYLDNYEEMASYSAYARNFAVKYLNWEDRKEQIEDIFVHSKIEMLDHKVEKNVIKYNKMLKKNALRNILPTNNILGHVIKQGMSKLKK